MNQPVAYTVLIGMSLLFIWGVSCIAYGYQSRKQSPSVKKYCREMTLYWGVINTLLGIFAVITVLRAFDSYDSDLAAQQELRRIFGLNVGLDFVYILAGLITAYAGRHISARRRGYGLAIVVQGVFLFILDGILSIVV